MEVYLHLQRAKHSFDKVKGVPSLRGVSKNTFFEDRGVQDIYGILYFHYIELTLRQYSLLYRAKTRHTGRSRLLGNLQTNLIIRTADNCKSHLITRYAYITIYHPYPYKKKVKALCQNDTAPKPFFNYNLVIYFRYLSNIELSSFNYLTRTFSDLTTPLA